MWHVSASGCKRSASEGTGEISFLRTVWLTKLENHDRFALTLARSVCALLPTTATVSKTFSQQTLFGCDLYR